MPGQGPEPRVAGLGTFAIFPDELICYLLHQLDARALLVLSATSKLMRVLVCEEPLWLQKHLERYARPFAYRGSWRATYMAHHPAFRRPELTASDLVPVAPAPGFTSDVLYRRWYRCHVDLSSFTPQPPAAAKLPPVAADGHATAATVPPASEASAAPGSASIPYIADASTMAPEDFEARYDQPGQPVMLGGLAKSLSGCSLEPWQPSSLAQAFGDRLFTASKPFLAGGRTRMRLADYLAYAEQQADEEPLYIFDASFAKAAPELLQMYNVPHVFRHDLFACMGERREDWRWLVVGPARSGASWHVDPSATSAWNTLLSGRKRWALYPPGHVPPGVEVSIDSDGAPNFETPTSLQWYLEIYPQLPTDQRPLEIVQQPGDTIYLPAGWWHCVLNLDITVAVTQNFVSPANLEAAVQWQVLGAGSLFDPHLAAAYLTHRQERYGSQLQSGKQLEEQVVVEPDLETKKSEGQQPGMPAKRRQLGSKQGGRHSKRRRGVTGQQRVDQDVVNDEAEAAQTAAEHLAELELGFQRDNMLGPWLRLMLQQRDAEQQQDCKQDGAHCQSVGQPRSSRVWQLVQQWTDVPVWRPRLARACRAAGLEQPRHPYEWLPLATGWCVVFEVAGKIIKFFPPTQPHATAMGCMEIAAYLSLEASSSQGSSGGARLLHSGLLDYSSSSRGTSMAQQSHAGAATSAAAPMPFLVLEKVPGLTLGSCMDAFADEQWMETAAAVGRSLATIHSLPLPAAAAPRTPNAQHVVVGSAEGVCMFAATNGHAGIRGVGSISSSCTAWIARDGTVYSSSLGKVEMRRELGARKTKQQQLTQPEQDHRVEQRVADCQHLVLTRLFPEVAAVLLGKPAQEGHLSPAAAGVSSSVREQPFIGAPLGTEAAPAPATLAADNTAATAPGCQRCDAWQPFVSFLRHQRRHADKVHHADGFLPAHLQEQLDSYLPVDPAVLVDCSCPIHGVSQDSRLAERAVVASVAAGAAPAVQNDSSKRAATLADNSACCCCSSGGCGSGSIPTWVHGDLTPGNVLLSNTLAQHTNEPQQPGKTQPKQEEQRHSSIGIQASTTATIIDFADSGQGDPLWDFVVLLIRTFRCNRRASQACMASYGAALAQSAQSPKAAQTAAQALACWPQRPQGMSLSYVAMCYTLLHELGPLHDVFKRYPQLWEADCLEKVQQAVWGWLDEFHSGLP